MPVKEWVPVVDLYYSTRADSGLRDRENDMPDPLAAQAMFGASLVTEVVGRSFSELHTSLKIDLGVRYADERDVPGFARSPADGDSRS
jgi:hypothetical protein